MLKTLTVIGAVLVCGCGGEKDCRDAEANGAYYVDWTTIDGDCGDIPSSVVVVGSSSSDCEILSKSVSDNECDSSMVMRCELPPDDLALDYGMALTTSESGKILKGTVTMEATELSTGAFICLGTYRVTMTRQ